MKALVRLQHVLNPSRRETFEIFGVSCAEVCACLDAPKPEMKIKSFMYRLIQAKMPLSLYNFKVLDWEFKD